MQTPIPSEAMLPAQVLQDSFGRRIRYLRVSLTEHCNFRCQYCSPAEGTPHFAREDHLRPEELDRLLGLFVGLGVQHLRFTGGEPLIYPHLLGRIRHARALAVAKISLSTNGYLLARMATDLVEAGVHQLNVSVDSLDPQHFAAITRGGDLARVLAGLQAARVAGFKRIKLNAVLLRQYNLDALQGLLEFAIAQDFDLQFIEAMPLGYAGSHSQAQDYFSVAQAREILEQHFTLLPTLRADDAGPSNSFQVAGTRTQVGFISPISENFCQSCNRLRLTASGRLVYCLGQEAGVDLLPLLREGRANAAIADEIRSRVWHEKPERHFFNDQPARSAKVFMMRLGG